MKCNECGKPIRFWHKKNPVSPGEHFQCFASRMVRHCFEHPEAAEDLEIGLVFTRHPVGFAAIDAIRKEKRRQGVDFWPIPYDMVHAMEMTGCNHREWREQWRKENMPYPLA